MKRPNRFWCRCVIGASTLTLSLQPSVAAPLVPYSGTYLLVNGRNPQGGPDIRIHDARSFDPDNPISTEVTIDLGPSSSVWVKGSATAGFGSLGAYTSAKLTDPTGLEFVNAYSVAQFVDRLMFNHKDHATGSPGYLSFGFHLDGTVSGSAFTRVDVLAGIPGMGSSRLFLPLANQSISGHYSLPQYLPFKYGESFDLDLELATFVVTRSGRTEGTSDFSSTLLLDSLDVFDGDRKLVTGWSYSAASGTHYQFAAVPEPATFGLAGLALLCLIGLQFSRRGHRD